MLIDTSTRFSGPTKFAGQICVNLSAHSHRSIAFILRLAMAAILWSPFAALKPSAAAGRVFYDGFEDGTVSKWHPSGAAPCKVVSAANDGVKGPYAGTKMVSCNSDGVTAWNDPAANECLVLEQIPYNKELFVRARMRIDSKDFDWQSDKGSPKKLMRFFNWTRVWDLPNADSLYNDMFEATYQGSGSMNALVAGGTSSPTYWGGKSGDNTLDTTSWHTVEYYLNAATGVVRVWHDHVLVRDDMGLPVGNDRWEPFYLTSNWSDTHDATNHVYFDEIEFYSDTGTGAAGLMSDATVSVGGAQGKTPSAPQKLVVQ